MPEQTFDLPEPLKNLNASKLQKIRQLGAYTEEKVVDPSRICTDKLELFVFGGTAFDSKRTQKTARKEGRCKREGWICETVISRLKKLFTKLSDWWKNFKDAMLTRSDTNEHD